MDVLLDNPKTWIALAFIIFMIGFFRYAVPFIVRALDTRGQKIKAELDEAVHLREQAQALLVDYQKKQKEMLAQAEEMIAHAKQEAEAMELQAREELQLSIERRTRLAHEKIARAEQEAIADIQSDMVNVAMTAAKLIIAEHIKNGSADELIDLALKDLDRIVH